MSWYKGEKVLVDEGRYVIVDEDEDQVFTLAIEDVLPEDEGEYRCVAKNEAGISESVAKLTVDIKYSPKFVDPAQVEPYFAQKGSDHRLIVYVKGNPTPIVKWFLDGKPLPSNMHYEICEDGNEYSLCIHSITLDDQGEYSCEATSELGQAVRKFQVLLQGTLVLF